MREARLTDHARENRKAMTEPETRLWLALRAKRFSATKFRRQKVIGPYIVDFASRDPMLVIELDGDSHGSQVRYDTMRSEYLEQQGYRVIRFTNADVVSNLEGVLTTIALAIAPLPTLPPKGERAKKPNMPSPLQGGGARLGDLSPSRSGGGPSE
ncbi:endonuclease domain-containing protein [Sphingorhabdus soli]|uniref:Endonuclease domain-containing protein n=1 Tax=Flavisphingopyxis soli TaxID=2601267 RepID=A0A5C6UNZ2_9SPHN|nr:endonuclease domain-containing protein [Sphingorhabdus soli]TXC74294.1 endonuclease domain-containing protein [Sphingorhabdus soli]